MLLHANQVGSVNRLLRPGSTREEILAFQGRALRRLLAHAYENVPYYRRLFDGAGLHPRDIRTVADLDRIPLTGKDDLRAVPVEDTVAGGLDVSRLQTIATSGATGQPFVILRTRIEQRVAVLFPLRALRHYGLRCGDRRAGIAAADPSHRPTLHWRTASALGVLRRLRLDLFEQEAALLAALRRFRPDVLGGPASALTRLADAATEEDRRAIRPRFMTSGSETLTAHMRERITTTFGAPVYEAYGCHELGQVAWECKETGGLHVCEEGVITEVTKDGRPALPGEQGELVGTNLYCYAMPFIRYRSGDAVTRGPDTCACGRACSTLSGVLGRMIDYFPLPDGRWLHPFQIGKIVMDMAKWARHYQLVQERVDRIVLRVVPFRRPAAGETRLFEQAVRERLGPRVEFEVAFVPEIAVGPGGKFQVALSHVRPGYYAQGDGTPAGDGVPVAQENGAAAT